MHPKSDSRDGFDELLEWMIGGARPSADARSIVSGICERLVALDVRVDRFMLFIYTLHPNLEGRRFRWRLGEGVDIAEVTVGTFTSQMYRANPLPHVLETQRPIHRRLEDEDCPNDYEIVGQLRDEGFTDYLIQPLIFITGETHACSWSSKSKGGFSARDLDMLARINAPLARLTETYMLRLNAATLLSTYVGRNSGQKILEGQIHRGDGEEITAVILFADLKNFTSLSNRLSGKELVALLNETFDRLVPHVTRHGGEILKFMGDGFFAIFPYDRDPGPAARAALQAVRDGVDALANDESGGTIAFRSAIHNGTFHYGNIGGGERLDFTAIGSPVNYAARLLTAAADLDSDHVISSQLADQSGSAFHLAGEVELKGFDGRHAVLTY